MNLIFTNLRRYGLAVSVAFLALQAPLTAYAEGVDLDALKEAADTNPSLDEPALPEELMQPAKEHGGRPRGAVGLNMDFAGHGPKFGMGVYGGLRYYRLRLNPPVPGAGVIRSDDVSLYGTLGGSGGNDSGGIVVGLDGHARAGIGLSSFSQGCGFTGSLTGESTVRLESHVVGGQRTATLSPGTELAFGCSNEAATTFTVGPIAAGRFGLHPDGSGAALVIGGRGELAIKNDVHVTVEGSGTVLGTGDGGSIEGRIGADVKVNDGLSANAAVTGRFTKVDGPAGNDIAWDTIIGVKGGVSF